MTGENLSSTDKITKQDAYKMTSTVKTSPMKERITLATQNFYQSTQQSTQNSTEYDLLKVSMVKSTEE